MVTGKDANAVKRVTDWQGNHAHEDRHTHALGKLGESRPINS